MKKTIKNSIVIIVFILLFIFISSMHEIKSVVNWIFAVAFIVWGISPVRLRLSPQSNLSK